MVLPVRVGEVDGLTNWTARGSTWRRSSRGLYVPADVELTPEQRIVEAAMVLPEYGGVTGWAGLRWLGGRYFDGLASDGRGRRPVHLACAGDDVRSQPGISISAERLDPRDLMVVDGLPLTSAARSVCFEMRYASTVERAALHLSMAAYDDLVSIDELMDYASRHPGWTGISRSRDGAALADENIWSPAEFWMGVVWVRRAGLPRPLCNAPLFDEHGRHIGTPDLFDQEVGLVGEYDGALHLQGAQRSRDLVREERFRDHGCEYVTMLAADYADLSSFIRRLRAAHQRAQDLDSGRRRWTLQQPEWWVDTSTVALRRGLTFEQRERWLRRLAA